MVRVVSQNFSTPRSRHSSGETDFDLAERANLALSSLGRKRNELPECESSSDSFWDSEIDGEHYDTVVSESGENGNDVNGNEKSDVQTKRRERRRERNKLSAQAYRMRRRNQNVKEQQELIHLEAENKRLHKLVEALEKKKEDARQRLRTCSYSQPLGAVGGVSPPQSNEAVLPDSNKNEIVQDLTNSTPHNDHYTYHPPFNPNSAFVSCLPKPQIYYREREIAQLTASNSTPGCDVMGSSDQKHLPAPVPTHFVINANTLKGTMLVSEEAKPLPPICIPTYFAVTMDGKDQDLNINMNSNSVKTLPKKPIDLQCHAPDDLCSATALNNEVNPSWWKGHKYQQESSHEKISEDTFCVKMEMCNTNINNANINANDPNGNCDKKSVMQAFNVIPSLSFNINHTTEDADKSGQGNITQHVMRHPKKHYFDRTVPVSVQ